MNAVMIPLKSKGRTYKIFIICFLLSFTTWFFYFIHFHNNGILVDTKFQKQLSYDKINSYYYRRNINSGKRSMKKLSTFSNTEGSFSRSNNTFNLWNRGLFGFINNSLGFCKIPSGIWEIPHSLISVTDFHENERNCRSKASPKFSSLTGINHDVLSIDLFKCLSIPESNPGRKWIEKFLSSCKKKFQALSLWDRHNFLLLVSSTTPIKNKNPKFFNLNSSRLQFLFRCPIYFLVKDKYTSTPHLKGKFYFGNPIEIPDVEQYIIVRCNGMHNTHTRVSRKGTDEFGNLIKELEASTKKLLQVQSPASLNYNGNDNQDEIHLKSLNIDHSTEENLDQRKKKIPMNLMILLLDGLSRVQFHRSLPLTIEKLKAIQYEQREMDDGYEVVEYFKYAAVDYSSNSNMTPFVSGINWWTYCNHKYNCQFTKNIPFSRFIWDIFRRKGFKTAFTMEQCWIEYQADWYYLRKGWTNYFGLPLSSLKQCMEHGRAECLFGKRPHQYMFQYLKEFNMVHKNEAKFSINLFLEPHETSMTVVKTMDKDLSEFLADVLKQNGNDTSNSNTWILILSDHGLHYGPYFDKTQSGKLEHKLPLLIAIAPRKFGKEYPHLWRNFVENSKRLTTAYVIYDFLKDFSNRFGPLHSNYLENKKNNNESWGISLFDEIPLNRTCKVANIPEYACTCNKSLAQIDWGWRTGGK